MGIEHLIAALGATWFMSSQEKKAQRRQEAAANAAYLAEADRQIAAKQYLSRQNFNRKRQHELNQLARSNIYEDRVEFAQILGRPYCNTDVSIERAVKAIADKEGWLYYDEDLLIYDAEYCRLSGMSPLAKEVVDAHVNRDKKRMRDEVRWKGWVERNPGCFEVNVSPEYYESEGQFILGIEAGYTKWRKTACNIYAVDAQKYDTKAAYQQAIEARKKELLDYRKAMDLLKIDHEADLIPFCLKINTLTEFFENRPVDVPLDLFVYMLYLHFCIPLCGGTVDRMELEYQQVLKVKARLHGVDLDDILAKAENGNLLPKKAKVLHNYYLSWFVLTEKGTLYTMHASEYYYRKYGFTLDDFAKTCGKDPSFSFRPPLRGLPINSIDT